MMKKMKEITRSIFTELRLLLCGWCFKIALWIAPKDDPEGTIIVEAIKSWPLETEKFLFLKYVKNQQDGNKKPETVRKV